VTNPLPDLIARGQVPNVTQVEPQQLPSIAEPEARAAVQALIERLEANYLPRGPTQDEYWYGWIALPLGTFLEGMLTARAVLGPDKHRFLDVGSGIGTKLILAHELGWHTTGIERWRPYIDVSRRLAPMARVLHGDGAQFMSYHRYDLIYLYGIATDPSDHEQINQHIVKQMKPGALFFCARRPFPDGLEHVAELIWRRP
jgi:SAM-dependent methyltransferase